MKRFLVGTMTAGLLAVMALGASTAQAAQTIDWTGNGLDSVTICVKGVDRPHLHWVLTPSGQPVDGTTAELFINGKDMGTMVPVGGQGALQLTISPGTKLTLEQLEDASVHADIITGSVGENSVLTISDGCVCSY